MKVTYILLAIGSILVPTITAFPLVMMAQQVTTIFGTILFAAYRRNRVTHVWWRRSFAVFPIAGAVFLLLVVDIAVSLVPLHTLSRVDGLGQPFYLLFLRSGGTIGTAI